MRRRPLATWEPELYRQRSMALRVEVAEIAWALVVSPAPADQPRTWRALSPEETLEVFERLMAAVSQHALTDRIRIEGPPSRHRS